MAIGDDDRGQNAATDYLQGNDLSVRRGKFTLTCSHWTTLPGLTVVLGLNGAGKTTLLQALAGMLPVTGKVSSHAIPVYLPQGSDIKTRLTVGDFLEYVAFLRGIPRSRRPAAVNFAMTSCELKRYEHAPVESLSGGWRRRAALAQALLSHEGALLLDEPTAALDVGASRDTWNLMRTLATTRPLIVATHDAGHALEFSSTVVAIMDGVVGPPRSGDALRAAFDGRREAPDAFVLRTLQGKTSDA